MLFSDVPLDSTETGKVWMGCNGRLPGERVPRGKRKEGRYKDQVTLRIEN